MKIAIMGAGGVGGFYGARLAKAGQGVTFIARGAHLEVMRRQGLRMESGMVGDIVLPSVQATDNPASIGTVDLVLICVKAYDLDEASHSTLPMIGNETAVIPLLNGVDSAERMGAVVGMRHLLGGTVFVNANLVEPGKIHHLAMDHLVFGELNGGTSARAEAIHHMFSVSGVEAELSSDIRKDIWRKFVAMTAISGVASVVRAPERSIMDDPDTRALLVDALREVEELAHRQGIDLEKDMVEIFLALLAEKPPNTKPSMLLDLERGGRLEVESIQGAALRLGEVLDVPMPVNRLIYAALKPHIAGAKSR